MAYPVDGALRQATRCEDDMVFPSCSFDGALRAAFRDDPHRCARAHHAHHAPTHADKGSGRFLDADSQDLTFSTTQTFFPDRNGDRRLGPAPVSAYKPRRTDSL